MKYYNVLLKFEDNQSQRYVIKGNSAKEAFSHVMSIPKAKNKCAESNLLDFEIEEENYAPIPAESRFELGQRDKDKFAIFDFQRKMMIQFIFTESFKYSVVKDFEGNRLTIDENVVKFMIEAEIWLDTYHYDIRKEIDPSAIHPDT